MTIRTNWLITSARDLYLSLLLKLSFMLLINNASSVIKKVIDFKVLAIMLTFSTDSSIFF